ncbi:Metalloprotease [Trametes versicolor FP-101664 SS1]|uniref:Metalloprotease n=1 Tax=Trametes versicolor (strain FP-101664) TaxID=717944 RepID=UPI0004624847|nr:Metalloprotease [Trametes versicolor FP-101664 SS1]EIW59235.1 Metalloprotease [Trametes versicolor FP-101664 SS1]
MATLVPPQPAPTWTHPREDIVRLTKEAIARYKGVEDKVASLSPEECNFDTVFLALAHAEAERIATVQPLTFLHDVSPSQAVRDASDAADSLLRDFTVDSTMRIDVFRAKQDAKRNIEASGVALDPEERRLVERMVLDGTRAGLALPEADRERLIKLKKEIEQASMAFRKNANEENGSHSFTLDDLKGVPSDVISGYTKRTEGDKELYVVAFKNAEWGSITRYAENPETRRVAYAAYESRLAVNAPILSRIFDLRRQIAQLLGYASWADYVTEVKMVKTGQAVEEFLTDLEQRLRPVGLQDRAVLLALKQKEHAERDLPFDGELYAWDSNYYDHKLIQTRLGIDVQRLREHFPVPHVVPAILAIYQELFELEFVEVDNKGQTWDPDVRQYAVWEKGATDESGFIGHCYIDLYPRDNKSPGTSVWPLVPGYTTASGARQYPTAAIVASLAKPRGDKPALLGHFDTTLLFHEFGHLFHELLSATRFARFHGTTGALDFAEAPSQMLENWCFEPKILTRLSKHYKTGEPLDEDFINKILKSRYTNVGMFYLRQVSFAAFDLRVHLSEPPAGSDYTKLWSELRDSVALLKTPEPCPGHAGFHHLVGDYSVGYYGYSYSLVFAADMYATVFKEDPLDPARGRLYREKILAPGSSKDEMDLLKDFLGREPNSEAFVKQLFGQSAASGS